MGFDFKGGHPEDHGIAPDGSVVPVPAYRHEIEVDVLRFELGIEAPINEDWDAWLRVPSELKRRRSSVVLVDPVPDPDDLAAMEKSMQIHHRPGTLTGLTDPRLLAARSGLRDVLVEGDTVVLAFGTSLPMGKTEENPYHLGDKGELHEHFQFGTGTFDPLLEAYWTVPVGDALRIDGYAIGRVSLYENFKGYRGPVELTIGLNGTVQVSERLSVQTGATVFHQGYAHWEGERDVNSGVTSTSALVGASWHVDSGLLFHAGLRLPLAQHILSSEGDTFELGPSVMMSASMAF